MELRDAFVGRRGRFRLLDRGLELMALPREAPILEIGSATGEGTAHMLSLGYTRLTGADIDAPAAAKAASAVEGARFFAADARNLPFPDGEFSAIISEAAFSVIPGKAEAAREYARVLAPGGLVLLNDFAVIRGGEHGEPGVPCLDGVQSMESYREIFERAGFERVHEREEYGEYIGIAMSLGKAFGVPAAEAGKYIVSAFGRDGYVADFFAHTKLTYCQMIFKKV